MRALVPDETIHIARECTVLYRESFVAKVAESPQIYHTQRFGDNHHT